MSGTGNTTVPASSDDPSPRFPGVGLVPALVRVWSAAADDHLGEVALFDAAAHSEWILGRDAATPDDPAPRALCFRQRPGENLPGGLLTGNTISRVQLHVRQTPGGLEITNIGAAKLLINGCLMAPDVRHRAVFGDVVQIVGHSMYLLVERPLVLSSCPCDLGPLHAFGEPDAHGIVGESPAVWAFRAALAAAASTLGHVFVHGPTSTGKELAAQALHRLSGRGGPLVAYNAATLTLSLADSILFGNRAGYPNPGMPERPGLVGAAQGGTLFLDEIGELMSAGQATLLRTLDGEYTRQGESKPQRADLLVVCATNRDVSCIKHDVLPRFAYVVETPSVADRMEDIPLLVRHLLQLEALTNPALAARFVRAGAGGRPEVDVAAALILVLLRWPHDGNLRDLRNLLLRAMTETAGPSLMPPVDRLRRLPPPATEDIEDVQQLLDGIRSPNEVIMQSKELLHPHMVRHGWQLQKAAKAVGIDRHALARLLEKHGIRRPGGD